MRGPMDPPEWQGWKPCEEPGRPIDPEIVFCWEPCDDCHEMAVEARRLAAEDPPPVENWWTVITQIIERTDPRIPTTEQRVKNQLEREAREQQARLDAIIAELSEGRADE